MQFVDLCDWFLSFSITLGSSMFSSFQSLSPCPTLCDSMDCSLPGFPVHQLLPEFTQTHVHWVGDALQPPYPLLLPSFVLNLSQHRVFFPSESALCIRWPKCWSFSMTPSKGYSGLISFRMDWLDLLAVQGTLKHLLQHHTSKALILCILGSCVLLYWVFSCLYFHIFLKSWSPLWFSLCLSSLST